MTQPDVESGKFGASRKGLEVEAGVIWSRREADDVTEPTRSPTPSPTRSTGISPCLATASSADATAAG